MKIIGENRKDVDKVLLLILNPYTRPLGYWDAPDGRNDPGTQPSSFELNFKALEVSNYRSNHGCYEIRVVVGNTKADVPRVTGSV